MAEITKKMVLDIDSSASYKSVKELRNELKNIKDGMAGLQEGSDAFLEMANKAGEVKHQLDAINQATRAASKDFGDLMSNTAKVGAGMVGAFQSVKGAMTLLGVESENVEAAIQKMQASMAIVQGLQSIDGGIKSFKTLTTAIGAATQGMNKFKVALVATGLGALVVVLGSIIANWDEFTESIGLSSKQLLKLQDVWNGVMGVISGSLKGLTRAITKIITGDFKGAWEAVKDGFNVVANYEKAVTDGIIERETKAANEYKKVWADAHKKAAELWWEQIELQRAYAGAIEHTTEARKKHIDAMREEEEEDLSNIERLKELYNVTADIDYMLAGIAGGDSWAKLGYNINAILDSIKVLHDTVENGGKTTWRQWTQLASAAFETVGAMMSTLAAQQDTTTKEGFEQQKKFQIAATVMNMLGGIANAWISAMNPANAWMTIWGQLAAGTTMSSLIATTAGLQIDQIKNTQFGGGTSTSASTPNVNQSAVSSISSPVQYTQDVQGASIEQTIKDTRIYVTESDISDTQKRVNVAESEARF